MARAQCWQGGRLLAEWKTQTDPLPEVCKRFVAEPHDRTLCPWTGYKCSRFPDNWVCGCMPTDLTRKRFKPPYWVVFSYRLPVYIPTQQLSFLDEPVRKRDGKGFASAYLCEMGAGQARRRDYRHGYRYTRIVKVDKEKRRWRYEEVRCF